MQVRVDGWIDGVDSWLTAIPKILNSNSLKLGKIKSFKAVGNGGKI